MFGELVPVGGGDTIPLLKQMLLVGRRESCDIVLRFSNVSAHHCELTVREGYWFVRDLDSRNGVKVNAVRVHDDKRIDPGDTLHIATHGYEMKYSPAELGAVGPPPPDDSVADIFEQPLLKRAKLEKDRVRDVKQRKPGPIIRRATNAGDPENDRSSEEPI
jgi:adenylate cyclase